jgi:integrase
VDLFVVSKLLGHADPSLTAKRYAHLRPGIMAEAAERAGRLVAEAEEIAGKNAEAASE